MGGGFFLLLSLAASAMAGTKLGFLGRKAANEAFGTDAQRSAMTGLLAPSCTGAGAFACTGRFTSTTVTHAGVECLIVRPCGMPAAGGGGAAPLFAGKVVFFIPGSGGSAQDYGRAPAAYFVTQGAAFVGLNPRGWGGSQTTSRTDIGDATITRDVLTARNYIIRNFFGNKNAEKDVIMVGYSLGGHSAAAVSSDCAGLLLLSPIDSVKAVVRRQSPRLLAPIMASVGGAALNSNFETKTALAAICDGSTVKKRPRILVLTGNMAAGDHLAAGQTGIVNVPNCITVSETPNGAAAHTSLATIMGTPSQQLALSTFAASLPTSTAYPTATRACVVPGGGGGGGGGLPVVVPPGGGAGGGGGGGLAVLPLVVPPLDLSSSSSSKSLSLSSSSSRSG
jgi:pimeloyl-ACP methyl ester carboxylesterase